MRHAVAGKKLNRDSQHRRATFKNLIRGLIDHGRIVTTPAKAKAVQGMIDTLVSRAKKGRVVDRRQIDQVLNHTATVNKLVDVIAPATAARQSGFTRTTKLSPRQGDNAPQVRLEWVDQVTPQAKEAPEKKAVSKKVPAKAVKPAKSVKPVKTAATPPITRAKQPAPSAAPKTGMIRQKSGER
jgi:large subunit ribosomal protein L17